MRTRSPTRRRGRSEPDPRGEDASGHLGYVINGAVRTRARSSRSTAAPAAVDGEEEAHVRTHTRCCRLQPQGVMVHALTTQIPGVISETAADWQADLLVLTPHHRDVFGALLDPRVSDAVVHKGRTSVLLVPENDECDPVELPVSDR
ncbi:universal stress protein [Streptomyces sp. NA03103]|uniref:universal stress protein n=1 Tax=Streptomyces TaxID=1883 RepID=UPI0015906B29|nr:universal stress protein [Streptomyces sp. NA03103]QKW65377.1 universal stress protein [Streptomyces sp. NA03103]